MDNVCELATSLIFTEDLSRVIRDSYGETLIDVINLEDIIDSVKQMTYENCKVVLSGKKAT
jgi:hypothetical protein